MTTRTPSVPPGGRPASTPVLAAVIFAAMTLGLLWWAKWHPYSIKVPDVASSGSLGESIITGGSELPPAVSLVAGLDFAVAYFRAVWPALFAGLVIAAAVEVVLPGGWMRRALGRGGVSGGVRGGLLAIPTLMCSCCAAPVTVGLRRAQASVGSALAYWVGNPALNPVVIVFAVLVLPWEWALLRAAGGVLVVAGVIGVTGWLTRHGHRSVPTVDCDPPPSGAVRRQASTPVRFGTSLGGMAVRLLPEYAVVVVLLGSFRGALFGLSPDATVGMAAVLLLVVAGLLLPIPTGAEIAVVSALLALGVGGAAAGALLLTLPAISLPSLLMVRRVFPGAVLLGTTGVVAAVGLLLAAVAAGWGL